MTKLTWEEHMKIVNANTGLGQALTLSSESFKKLNQKLLEARKKKQKKSKSASSQAGGPAPDESALKRHQKNTKVFKTLQDAIIYNAKERSK